MFRSMSGEEHLSGRQSSSSVTGHGVTSPGLDSQESSWIGLLSGVSRPALSFLQKYLPGRSRSPGPGDARAGWMSADLKTSFVDEEREFLRQLDLMPLTQQRPQLTCLRCEHDEAAGLLEPEGGSTLPWLTAESLREIGIQSAEEMDLNLCHQSQTGHLSSARTFLSQVWLSSVSPQEVRPSQKDWGRTWWGSWWGGEAVSQTGLLSDLMSAEDGRLTVPWRPQTKHAATETTVVFVQSGGEGWTLGENTGPTEHKEEPANNGGLHTVQNRGGSTPDQQLSIRNQLSCSEAATCSAAAPLTLDQDNGYSSLEEEQVQMSCLYLLNAPCDEQLQEAEPTGTGATNRTDMETSEEVESTSGPEEQDEEQEATALPAPQCQNKAIAFIMGCPCSDDDSSQSDGGSSDEDDDDDGFDSEGSSDLSDSTDEDDDSSDSEDDSEAERLWRSLCHSVDPYDPRNFTARLQTGSTPPRTVPTATPPSSAQSTPASSPLSSPPLSSSPPSAHDAWDDSTSASEVDEAESVRLWTSFSCSSDPYSPFNFQAPLRTRGPAEAGPRARARKASQSPPFSSRRAPASAPEYRKEDAEERLDSGFSEPAASCSSAKKVRFRDDVEEFFASCGEEEEDRRGPWEELARDRCRFLRRCQEVEQSIAFCLQPQHRRHVYQRFAVLHVQDA